MKHFFTNKHLDGFAPMVVIFFLMGIAALGIGMYVFEHRSASVLPPGTPSPSASAETMSSWKTYTNQKYGYEIQYPGDWAAREFPNTKTGVGFSPQTASSTPGNDAIVVDAWQRPGMFEHMPFDTFVKQAGMQYVQNYQSLASIEPVKTDSGVTGYETTWNVVPLKGGATTVSAPIAFFHKQGDEATDYVVRTDSNTYADVYSTMLKTFAFQASASSSPAIVGGDKDSHGCIGSAGYTWCQAKNQCIRSWEQYCTAAQPKTVTFACDAGKTIKATFYPSNDKFVDLVLSDGRNMSVPHAMSASGARYAKPDESFVFWNKGDTAFVTEGASSTETYRNCALQTN